MLTLKGVGCRAPASDILPETVGPRCPAPADCL
jgi:hypothetical protein